MNEEEIKDFLRKNLIIETENTDKCGPGNSINISLRFEGDEEPFTYDTVYVPDDD